MLSSWRPLLGLVVAFSLLNVVSKALLAVVVFAHLVEAALTHVPIADSALRLRASRGAELYLCEGDDASRFLSPAEHPKKFAANSTTPVDWQGCHSCRNLQILEAA